MKLRKHRRIKNKRPGLSWGLFIKVFYGDWHSARPSGGVLRDVQWASAQWVAAWTRP